MTSVGPSNSHVPAYEPEPSEHTAPLDSGMRTTRFTISNEHQIVKAADTTVTNAIQDCKKVSSTLPSIIIFFLPTIRTEKSKPCITSHSR
ncbi:hypothetical protein L1987_63460 [Smallanthus sonchifolius]|uniref:Uncharacterized protein n=1 Tax=Smallanthus sonchifolius TaxID=185202 RepID=A0ACB9CD73_9ASTR|nr:hypothetical protein L1987_63460 [Smallanthus sonchifolius]